MQSTQQTKLDKILNLEFTEEDNLWLTNGYTLRKLFGFLGMLLPVLLWLFMFIDHGIKSPLSSISHYYFTRAVPVFTIVVSLLAIFLIVYKGKHKVDFYLSLTAGIFALCLLIFPTNNITDVCRDENNKFCTTILDHSSFRVGFHYASAGIFLLSLALMSIFLFTKSKLPPSQRGSRKIARNRIYRLCGIVMIMAVLIVFADGIIFPDKISQFLGMDNLTFWMETAAVEAFGFSWLVKGEAILRDKTHI